MDNKYRVYYQNEHVPNESWSYIITAPNKLDAKWKGIIQAEKDGYVAGWVYVYCEFMD